MYKNYMSLEDYCAMSNIIMKDEEQWYDIKNIPMLEGSQISTYGRLKNKTGLIRLPLSEFTVIKYTIQKNHKIQYIKATDIMCQNIPELYEEDKYMGYPRFKNSNESNSYYKNIIPFWSKAKISEKDKWKKVDGFNLMMSSDGDIIKETTKELLRPTYKKQKMCIYIQNHKKLNLTKVSYILFHLNKTLEECQDFLNDESIRFSYKDGDMYNFSAENLILQL